MKISFKILLIALLALGCFAEEFSSSEIEAPESDVESNVEDSSIESPEESSIEDSSIESPEEEVEDDDERRGYTCTISGDPHITTFHGKRYDFYAPGRTVKSQKWFTAFKYGSTQVTVLLNSNNNWSGRSTVNQINVIQNGKVTTFGRTGARSFNKNLGYGFTLHATRYGSSQRSTWMRITISGSSNTVASRSTGLCRSAGHPIHSANSKYWVARSNAVIRTIKPQCRSRVLNACRVHLHRSKFNYHSCLVDNKNKCHRNCYRTRCHNVRVRKRVRYTQRYHCTKYRYVTRYVRSYKWVTRRYRKRVPYKARVAYNQRYVTYHNRRKWSGYRRGCPRTSTHKNCYKRGHQWMCKCLYTFKQRIVRYRRRYRYVNRYRFVWAHRRVRVPYSRRVRTRQQYRSICHRNRYRTRYVTQRKCYRVRC